MNGVRTDNSALMCAIAMLGDAVGVQLGTKRFTAEKSRICLIKSFSEESKATTPSEIFIGELKLGGQRYSCCSGHLELLGRKYFCEVVCCVEHAVVSPERRDTACTKRFKNG